MTHEELREARIVIGLTQTQLGSVLGYTREHIAQLEGGRRAIQRPAALAVEAMLDGWRPDDWPHSWND